MTAAERSRLYRERRREGRRVVRVEVSEEAVQALIDAGVFDDGEADLAEAMAELIEDYVLKYARSVTRDGSEETRGKVAL